MWFLLLFLIFPHHISATNYQRESSVSISASIGENRVTIYGYTSPNSRVELSSPRVFAVTYSGSDGYFLFDKTLLPKNPSDLCLTSFDNNYRSTSPVCIPPPPVNNYHTDIGPILLPPTISLENDQINPNTTIVTSGQAIPNSQVNVSFYKINDSGVSFPKEVQAYSLPLVTAATDKDGNFSINLPTAYSSDYRLYASAKFNDNYSPKSNTLIYILPSLFYLFIQQNRLLIILLPIFILTIMVFFYLLHLRSEIYDLRSRYLPAIKNFFPAVTSCKIKKSNIYHLRSKN